MNDSETKAWAERLWKFSATIKLDLKHRELASVLVEKAIEDPEQVAFILAALLQNNTQCYM